MRLRMTMTTARAVTIDLVDIMATGAVDLVTAITVDMVVDIGGVTAGMEDMAEVGMVVELVIERNSYPMALRRRIVIRRFFLWG